MRPRREGRQGGDLKREGSRGSRTTRRKEACQWRANSLTSREPAPKNGIPPHGARVSTKICPNCNAEVPSIANLCKHCFHDFHVVVAPKKSPWWTLLFLGVGTSIVAAWAFAYLQGQYKTSNISIDRGSQLMVFTTKYPDRTEASRVYFKDVAQVEYVKNTAPQPFMIFVVTKKGERFTFAGSGEPIDYKARDLATELGATVIEKDEYAGPSHAKN